MGYSAPFNDGAFAADKERIVGREDVDSAPALLPVL
jgi:hypothetical protein